METINGKNVRVRDSQWHYRFNFRGREYSGPTGLAGDVSNQTAAEEFAERRRAELRDSRPGLVAGGRSAAPVAMPTSFAAASKSFLEWARETQYRAKPNTAERLRVSFVSLVAFFGETPVRSIDAAAVERFKANRARVDGVREVTIRHDLHALSVFFRKWAVNHGLASGNPVRSVTIPSDREAIREHVVTAEEEAKYFTAAGEMYAYHKKSFKDAQPTLADVARLMLEHGCRPEEILASRKDSFDAGTRTLRILGGKTRAARRTVYLTDASVEILSRRVAYRPESPWLFPSDRHRGRHVTKLGCAHDRVCGDAGVTFRLYDLRHTFATRAIEAGVPVAIVAALLGHSGLRTIHRYVHPSAEAQREAMALVEAAAKRRAG